ncbi:MAG: hypothetical protein WC683_15755 [bacterium]
MKCPDCGREMGIGSPHDIDCDGQWECHECGTIIPFSVLAILVAVSPL